MNPAPQLRGPPATTPPGLSSSTTYAGRSWFSVPGPEVPQPPSEGRPARIEPVFIWQTPPTWFSPFDQHERITARSSAQPARGGSQSETQRPPLPCRAHLRFTGRMGDPDSPIGVMTGLKLEGSGLPAS